MLFNPNVCTALQRVAARTKAVARLKFKSLLNVCAIRVASKVAASRRGVAAVEFGLIGVAFITLIFAIMEVALQLTTIAALEWATLRVSRFGSIGTNTAPGTGSSPPGMPSCRSAMIPWLVSYSTADYLKSANLTVTMSVLSSLGATGAGTAGAGAGGAIVRYSLVYRQDYITPIIATLAGATYVTHNTTLVVKNEPFENAYC